MLLALRIDHGGIGGAAAPSPPEGREVGADTVRLSLDGPAEMVDFRPRQRHQAR